MKIRLLTGLMVTGLCLFAVWRGWAIVQFAEARGSAPAGQSEHDGNAWAAPPGIRIIALERALNQSIPMSDASATRQQDELLSGLLSLQPMSSIYWFDLAEMRQVIGASHEQVLSALEMSWITGPNEDDLTAKRGLFGLLLWDTLPFDAQQRTIIGLSGALAGGLMSDRILSRAKKILQTKPEAARAQIAGMLARSGVPEADLPRLGL